MNQTRHIIRSIIVASAALSCSCTTKSFGEEAISQDPSLRLAKDALDNGVNKSMTLEEWEPKCFRMDDMFKLKNPLGVRQELASMGMLRVNMLSKDGQCVIGGGVDDNFYAAKSLLEFLSLSLVENVQLSYGSHLDHIFTWNKDKFELEQRTLDSDVHRDVHSFESRTKSNTQFGLGVENEDSIFSILTVFGDKEIVQNKREEQQKPVLPVIVEFPYIGKALVSMKPCEVLFLVGNQWQRSLEHVKIENQKDFDSSILPRTAKYSLSDFHDRPSLLFVLKGSEEKRTDAMVGRRSLKVAHQQDLHEKSLGNMDMDMDMDDMDMDDMDHDNGDGTSFCSGGGMIMNMDGWGFSINNADRSCLNFYFESWTLDNGTKFTFAMIGAVALGFFAEWIPTYKSNVWKTLKPDLKRNQAMAALHAFHLAIGYVCMLAAMTYSVEIFFCLLVGFALGYYKFANFENPPSRTVDPCCAQLMENDVIGKEPLLSVDGFLSENLVPTHHVD